MYSLSASNMRIVRSNRFLEYYLLLCFLKRVSICIESILLIRQSVAPAPITHTHTQTIERKTVYRTCILALTLVVGNISIRVKHHLPSKRKRDSFLDRRKITTRFTAGTSCMSLVLCVLVVLFEVPNKIIAVQILIQIDIKTEREREIGPISCFRGIGLTNCFSTSSSFF